MAVLSSYRWAWLLWAVFLLVTAAARLEAEPRPATPTSQSPSSKSPFRPEDPLNASAFDHFYNLDYQPAVSEFEQVLKRHPDDPFAVNHLLTAVLFQELYRIGALDTSEYANDTFVSKPHRPPDPKVQQRIKDLVEQASRLEEKRLAANPNDIDALYARGVTRAEFATYIALVERAWFSALRNAVGARRDHERVLELDPGYTDAKLIVGAHNYVMGSLSWAVKVAVAMVGLSGSKQKGLEYLQDAANAGAESSVDAKIVLVVFLRREKRYGEALQLVRSLLAAYPRNLLLALEEGNLLRAAGKDAEAAASYRAVWQAGKDGRFPGLHYEAAAVSLGDLLRNQKDYTAAAAAYGMVDQVQKPDPEVSQKADLGAAEMYDLLQKRDQALKSYHAVIATDGSTSFAEKARQGLKEPYHPD
jgi:tetratricopeptide (TPR) repeat protein